jgi:hypothetical protein
VLPVRRLVVLLMAGLVAGTGVMAATASGRSGSRCSVQSAGGVRSSAALGGWSYEVQFTCSFALRRFRVQTNKRLRSGRDKFGLAVPYSYAALRNGQQANFTCKDTTARSVTCTVSPALPARIVIGDGFDSSTPCRNTKRGRFEATLTVNRHRTPVLFEGRTSSGSLTGGCA